MVDNLINSIYSPYKDCVLMQTQTEGRNHEIQVEVEIEIETQKEG